MFGTEETAEPFAGDVFDLVVAFTAAVVSFAGLAVRIFVGEDGSNCFHDLTGNNVFGCDEFEPFDLTLVLFVDEIGYFRIKLPQKRHIRCLGEK